MPAPESQHPPPQKNPPKPNPPRGGPLARRIGGAVLVTALIPLVATLILGFAIITRISATAFQPEFGAHLDQALLVYADFARATKQSMRFEADAIAQHPTLIQKAKNPNPNDLKDELSHLFNTHPSLVSLAIENTEGETLAKQERKTPLDKQTERTLTVRRPLGNAPEEEGPFLIATLSTPNERFAEMDEMHTFVQAYHQLEMHHRAEYLDRSYQLAFASILVLLIVLSIVAGLVVARPVSRRISDLAAAMLPVAAGDLSIRVHVTGKDEVSALGQAFNQMLEELERSRARIEFLKRMGEWQQMARHLAHEIKNPLTPIQLAVQECHRRYTGPDEDYRQILQTTLEVVEEEVGTLRRLVTEFSNFARLPQAELIPTDLAEFLREQQTHLKTHQSTTAKNEEDLLLSKIDIEFKIEEGKQQALLDKEMMHRVLTNLIQNAAQALRDAPKQPTPKLGKITISLQKEKNTYLLDIDDSGPGIPKSIAENLFDPYVTTKRDGTGLGLTIVKKIIVDHSGTIQTSTSPLGGAKFRILLPTYNGE